MAEARCAHEDIDPEMFFPDAGRPPDAVAAFCRRCPVQQQCLEYAMENEDGRGHGIYGGLSAPQRAQLRRSQLNG